MSDMKHLTIEDRLDLFEHRVIQKVHATQKDPSDEQWKAANHATEKARQEILEVVNELRAAVKTGHATVWAMKVRLGVAATDAEKKAVTVLDKRLSVMKAALDRAEGK